MNKNLQPIDSFPNKLKIFHFFLKNLPLIRVGRLSEPKRPTTYNSFEPEGSQSSSRLSPSETNVLNGLQPKKGFTLIELLVVIGIISVVTGIVMASINSAKAKGRDSKRIADISVIQLALERYYDNPANKKYPVSLSDISDSSMSITYNSGYSYSYFGNIYLYKALNGNNTATCSSSDCQSYHLGATLELNSGILTDDIDLISGVSGDFSGADNTTTLFVYDVVPKF